MSKNDNFISNEEIEAIGKAGDLLTEDVLRADNSIKIYGGEGYYLYDHPYTLLAFRQKKKDNPKLTIEVILSPVIFVEVKVIDKEIYEQTGRVTGLNEKKIDGKYRCGLTYKYNGLLELAKNGIIDLYRRPTRTNHFHYRIVDGGKTAFRTEGYHPILAPFDQRRPLQGDVDVSQLNREFDNLIKEGMVCSSNHPFNEFLLLPFRDIKEVYEKVSKNGKDFDALTTDEIRNYL